MGKRSSESPRIAPWRHYVLVRADAIHLDVLRNYACMTDHDRSRVDPIRIGIERHLNAARHAARSARSPAGVEDAYAEDAYAEDAYVSRWQRFVALCAGSLIECAFRRLHAAKAMMVAFLPPEEVEATVPEALARLRKCLAPDDLRLVWAEAKLLADKNVTDGLAHPQPRLDQLDQGIIRLAWADDESGALQRVTLKARSRTLEIDLDPSLVKAERQTDLNMAARQAQLYNIVRLGYDAQDERHARLRNFRNIVGIATLVLTLLTIAISILGAVKPDALPLCFHPQTLPVACPTGKLKPTGGDVALVATLGLLGGALSAALAIRRLSGKSTPYQTSVVLSLFKLPSGAVISIVGLLLLRGDFIPGFSALDTQDQILAYAVVFGFAQQLATRLVDRQAREVLGGIPSKGASPGRVAMPSGASSPAPGDSD